MADISRLEKLASARKKLKKFQKEKKKPVEEKPLSKVPEVVTIDFGADPVPDSQSDVSRYFVETNNQIYEDFVNLKTKISDNTNENISQIQMSSTQNSSLNIPDNEEVSTTENNSVESKFLGFRNTSSSSESLKQITQQLNGLMNDEENFFTSDADVQNCNTTQLENRNQELAAHLQYQEQLTQQQLSEIQQLKDRNQSLQALIDKEREQLKEKSFKEQGSLKEQLQVHIQTIGILVAEKTELQSALTQSQRTAKQKAGEVEELDGRLKASRQRLADVDKELQSIKASKEEFENNCKASSGQVDKLKIDVYKLNKSNEDLQHQIAELGHKIQVKNTECQNFEKELTDTKKKLTFSELKVQQLSNNSTSEMQHQIEVIHEKNILLESQTTQYKESIQKLSDERDSLADQYQNYIQQLNQQITSLRDELNTSSEDCDRLRKEKKNIQEELENKCGEKGFNARDEDFDKHVADVERLNQEILVLEEKNLDFVQKLELQKEENLNANHMLIDMESKLRETENALARFRDDEVDKGKLLETMQSDKVAASRAMAQNIQLKKRLEELQEGFVQFSNDKLQLTDQIISEQQNFKELQAKISEDREEIGLLHSQLSEKNEELNRLIQESYEAKQIKDRIQHYEAQSNLSGMLQNELKSSQETITSLSSQNNQLRALIEQQNVNTMNGANANLKIDQDVKKDDMVASLSASVKQLELERDQLLRQVDDEKSNVKNLTNSLKNIENTPPTTGQLNGDINYGEDNIVLQDTHHKLEVRFKKSIGQVAELTEQKQQLEHLVLQLQGETETIGDYIALYQVQRGLMKKWAAEKDEYISQLSRDREELKSKLSQLETLVVSLVNKKQVESDQLPESLSQKSSRPVSPYKGINDRNANQHLPASNLVDQSPTKDWETASSVSSEFIPTTVSQYQPIEHQAKKIMELISDIGSTTLGDKPVLDTFHPCSVCSGRLITV